MPYFELQQELSRAIQKTLTNLNPALGQLTASDIHGDFSSPPNATLGHIALPCFKFAKALKTSPAKLATDFAAAFKSQTVQCTAQGPYLNFRWPTASLYERTLTKVLQEKTNYGTSSTGANKTVILEFCSPNIAKPLFFHHIRSTLIGSTLAKIYAALGYKVHRMNFVGDWGTQFARLVAAYEMWGKEEKLSAQSLDDAMGHLLEIYVRFHKELETNPELEKKAAACLGRLESKDAKTMALWTRVRDVSLRAMDGTLKRLNVSFDLVEGESAYIDHIQETFKVVKEMAGAKMSEGAWIVELPEVEPPALIQKKDGTTLYLTRDIAAAMDRYKRFHFHKSYYVVSEQQRLHFRQLFGVLSKMGLPWAKDCEHLSFGTVLFNSERMSTREGRSIYLADVLNEAKKLALEECAKKNPDQKDKELVAEMVGTGAVIFGNLSTHKARDINFDWKQVLTFDGETGPYVQYSLVRCESILAKGNTAPISVVDCEKYAFGAEEDQLIFMLSRFRSVLHDCTRDNEPYLLTHYLIDLAKAFNKFYYQFPVLQAADPLQKSLRLSLVKGTHTVLTNGLTLLGISCPREM